MNHSLDSLYLDKSFVYPLSPVYPSSCPFIKQKDILDGNRPVYNPISLSVHIFVCPSKHYPNSSSLCLDKALDCTLVVQYLTCAAPWMVQPYRLIHIITKAHMVLLYLV